MRWLVFFACLFSSWIARFRPEPLIAGLKCLFGQPESRNVLDCWCQAVPAETQMKHSREPFSIRCHSSLALAQEHHCTFPIMAFDSHHFIHWNVPSPPAGQSFRVDFVLGQGAFATVYQATNLTTSEKLFLKVRNSPLTRLHTGNCTRSLANGLKMGFPVAPPL